MPEAVGRSTGITLAQLAASGRHVFVQCGRCPNRRLAKPSEVSDAGALLKCGDCGSTEVLTYPESNRDARKGRIR